MPRAPESGGRSEAKAAQVVTVPPVVALLGASLPSAAGRYGRRVRFWHRRVISWPSLAAAGLVVADLITPRRISIFREQANQAQPP